MHKTWVITAVVLVIGYFVGIFMPGPGNTLKAKVGL